MSSQDTGTRIRILEATVRLLESRGGPGGRTGDIARAAGISRQAVYLHFTSRAALLEATTRYLDEKLGLEQRLARSRAAGSGAERLDAYIEFWGQYIPRIYAVARALLVARETDAAAAAAWNDRMEAWPVATPRRARPAAGWTVREATDYLWTLLSVTNWEQLTQVCGWSGRKYIKSMKRSARRLFIDG